jgi:hypothetical protein
MPAGSGHPLSLGRHEPNGSLTRSQGGADQALAAAGLVGLDGERDPAGLQELEGEAGSGPSMAQLGAYGGGAADDPAEALIGIDEVQKALNRSRASVYRYTNTDPRNLNPPFNPRKLNPEYRSDQKDPLLFHPNEVARFARDVLRIKEVTVEVLNAPSTATQQLLGSILDELRGIRQRLDRLDAQPGLRSETLSRFDHQNRPAA